MASNSNFDELNLDCDELRRLAALTTRDSVRSLLTKQIEELEVKVKGQGGDGEPSASVNVEVKTDSGTSGTVPAATEPTPVPVPVSVPVPSETQTVLVSKLPVKKITTYGWDQSPNFVKVYVTLKGVQNLGRDDITTEFSSSSFALKVTKKDCIHQFNINSLLQPVVAEKCYHKVKTDSIVVFLKKTSDKKWDYLTKTEQKAKEKKKPAPPTSDAAADPSKGIMDLMKQMYDEGDDEMKRLIAKTWTESREKKDTMDLP